MSLRQPPQTLKVETTPQAHRFTVQTVPRMASIVAGFLLALVASALIAAPQLQEEPEPVDAPVPQLMDFDHLEWHVCEGLLPSEMGTQLVEHCQAHAPFSAQPNGMLWNRMVLMRELPSDEAMDRVEEMARDAWAEQHRRAIAVYGHEQMLWAQNTTFPEPPPAPSRVPDVLAGLGLLLLAWLLFRIYQTSRLLDIVMTDNHVVWGGRQISCYAIRDCMREGDGLLLHLLDGTTLASGPTTHDREALDWIAEAIDRMAATPSERAEEAQQREEVRSRHAALVGRVKA